MVLGAEPGEIMAIRNIGGRITPGVLEELFMLRNVAGSVGDEYEGWELIVMQHTQCGILRLKDRPELLAPYFEVDESELGGKSVADPYKAVVQDVAALRADARLAAVRTSGLVYDVATGLVEIVVAP
jgi:carbonic anhydrase